MSSSGSDKAWYPVTPVGHTTFTWGTEGRAVPLPTTVSSSSSSSSSTSSAPVTISTTPVVLGNTEAASSSAILPEAGKRNILVTSALPYVNNVPHLGNIIGCVLSADVYARFCRLRGHNMIYICGTDEYGTATETKAIEAGCTPKEICDKYHVVHKAIYDWFNISFDHFGRTTTEEQTQIAQDIFLHCEKNGWTNIEETEQLYCATCSRFLADRFVEGICPDPACAYDDARGDQCDKCGKLVNAIELIQPKCKLCKSTPAAKKSAHIFLDLQRLQPELQAWVNEQKVKGNWNENAISITEAWLQGGLKPRAITRDLKWGTPVPKAGFEDKVFYVWFDAPIGYISITACYTKEWTQWWKNPQNVELVQFMGKDNIPFHCVVFPSTLMAAKDGYTLLHHISTTEYLNYEGLKFSKSRGTGVFGDDAMKTGIASEVWRYYMLINRPENADTVFLWEDFAAKTNSELLNNLGNFINRTLAFVASKFNSVLPALPQGQASLTDEDKAFLHDVVAHKIEYVQTLEAVKIKDGLKTVMSLSKRCNQYMQENKPWELFKTDKARCDTVMYVCVNVISLLSVLIEPYMPTITEKINAQINQKLGRSVLANVVVPQNFSAEQSNPPSLWSSFEFVLPGGHTIGTPSPLFRRIEDSEIEQLRLKFGGAPQSKSGVEFPVEIKLGRVLTAQDHAEAPHLIVVTMDCGEPKPRQIVAAVKPHYEAKDLIGRHFAVITNLKPSNFKGVRSEGMIITAVKGKAFGLLTAADEAAQFASADGSSSSSSSAASSTTTPSPYAGVVAYPAGSKLVAKPNYDVKKEFKKLDLLTRDVQGTVFFGDLPLTGTYKKDGKEQTVTIVAERVGQAAKLQ